MAAVLKTVFASYNLTILYYSVKYGQYIMYTTTRKTGEYRNEPARGDFAVKSVFLNQYKECSIAAATEKT